jgi:hypothetical protein
MAFDLESYGQSAADVNDSGVFSRALENIVSF